MKWLWFKSIAALYALFWICLFAACGFPIPNDFPIKSRRVFVRHIWTMCMLLADCRVENTTEEYLDLDSSSTQREGADRGNPPVQPPVEQHP